MPPVCELERLKAEVNRLLPIVQRTPRIRQLRLEHGMYQLSLREAATLCSMSATDFRRKFQATTGVSFHQFLILLRLAQATELLLRPDLTITHAALASGFGSLSALEYTFKRLVHSSPG